MSDVHRTEYRVTGTQVVGRRAYSETPGLLAWVAAVVLLFPSAVAAQSSPIVGRWDLVIAFPGQEPAPAWFEVRRSGRSTLVGEVLIVVGSARPISKVEFNASHGEFRFVVPPQWDDSEGDNTISGRVQGDSIVGSIAFANGKRLDLRGSRAPSLRRATPPAWGMPIPLLKGSELTEWKPLGSRASGWVLENGVLRNLESGANLVTVRQFTDFKLHMEFRYPAGGNSGVYLRGRYEVQIEDTRTPEPQLDGLGAIYGLIAANQNAARNPGEWQSFDITLIGRTVTVVLNGQTIISERVIPGITGGALDSDEAKPGPIYLQGDHGPVDFRNIVITPAKSP